MITRADQYLYTDVSGLTINGGILPAVDGTSSANSLRMENIAFLVEAARERVRWLERTYVATLTESYSPSDRLLERNRALSGVYSSVAYLAHFSTTTGEVSSGQIIPRDWTYPGLSMPLIVRATETSYPLKLIRATMTGFDTTISGLSVLPKGDDIRSLYYDLSRMSRFAISVKYYSYNKNWADSLTAFGENLQDTDILFGFIAQNDGNYITHYRGTDYTHPGYPPRFGSDRSWDTDGSVKEYNWLEAADPLVLVRKGFYNNPLNPSAPFLPQSMNGWAEFWISVYAYDSTDGGDSLVRMVGPITLSYYGSTEGTIFADIADAFYVANIGAIRGWEILAQQWCRQNIEGFAEKPRWLSIVMNGKVVADAPVNLNTEIDSLNWAWTPQK